MITEPRTSGAAGAESALLTREVLREEPLIRPSLIQAEILKALKEAGTLEDRDAIKLRALESLRSEPRRDR